MNELANSTKTELTWPDLFILCERDNGGRWYAADEDCAKYIQENGYRTPSRAWPHSHSKPLLTKKFAKWLCVNAPEKAEKFGLI